MEECKFTDEKIIKALELCIQNTFCESCEYREKTDKSDICPIRMDALNLINKQNAEIETLKDNNEHLAVILEETRIELKAMRGAANSYKMHYEKAMEVQKEVYRLASEIKAELPSAKAELAKNVASEIFAEIEKEIDTGISVIEKILNTKGGRANGKTVPISKYDVYIEAKKHLAELKKKYEVETK